MKLIQYCGIGLIVFCCQSVAVGQTYNLPPLRKYEEATVSLTSFEKFEARSLEIEGDSVFFQHEETAFAFHLNGINYIRVREGGKGLQGALIGGGTMLLLAIAGILQVQSDPNLEFRDDAGGRVLLYVAGGTALGGMIGGVFNKETSYYAQASDN